MITQTNSLSSPATDPLRNFKFQVTFHPSKGPAVPMSFMTVSGLSETIDTIPYREGTFNAVPVETPVLTVSGWKPMGDIEVGDQVIDPAGEPSKVTGVYPKGVRPVYRVTLADGRSVRADAEHLWQVEAIGHKTEMTVSTSQLKDLAEGRTARTKSAVRTRTRTASHGIRLIGMVPAQFEALHTLPIDPYLLGVLLSEGSLYASGGIRFAQNIDNADMINRVRRALPEGHALVSTTDKRGVSSHRITIGKRGRGSKDANLVLNAIRDLGLAGHRAWEKFIPEVYKFAGVEDRLALLQGLMDGDGHTCRRINGNKTQIVTTYVSTSERLRDDVMHLIRSLGGQCTERTTENVWYTSPTQSAPKPARDAYTIPSIQMPVNPFYMERKANIFRPKNGAYQRKVMSVELDGEADVQCISVSADSQCYVLDQFIPTHNTTPQKMPGQTDFSPITFTKGVMVGSQPQVDWIQKLFVVTQGTGNQAGGEDFRSTVQILVLDHPVTTASVAVKAAFTIVRAWPTAVAYSDLDAGANQLFISQLTLAHEGFTPSIAAAAGSAEASYSTS